MLKIFDGLYRGFKGFPAGVAWLFSHKKYLMLLLLPFIIGFIAIIFGWRYFFANQEYIMDTALFWFSEPSWYLMPIYWICWGLIYLGILILSIVLAFLVVNVLSAPIYEMISVAVEKDLSGGRVEEVSFWKSLLLIKEEIKKVLFICIVSILLLFIPGINVISLFVSAFLIGWDFYDYPMARRGFVFQDRLGYVKKDFWAIMTFGLWLMIPFVQIVLIPLAVAGGTMLSLDTLKKRPIEAAV